MRWGFCSHGLSGIVGPLMHRVRAQVHQAHPRSRDSGVHAVVAWVDLRGRWRDCDTREDRWHLAVLENSILDQDRDDTG